jgi:hypothetical protein
MKKATYLLAGMTLFLSFQTIRAQDTLYVLKKGLVDFKQSIDDIDSISYQNTHFLRLSDRIDKEAGYRLFSQALKVTGYADSIRNYPLEDRTYDPWDCTWTVKMYNIREEIPTYRKFGFTILMESDSVLANYKDCPLCPNGVRNLDELTLLAKYWYDSTYKGIYPDNQTGSDPTDPGHCLNRYVAYHLLDQKLLPSRFINDFDTPNQVKTYDLDEYKAPFLSNTLWHIRKFRSNPGTFFINPGPTAEGNTGVKLITNGMVCKDGYAYGIDKPLVYSMPVHQALSNKRLRMDAASFFKEFANNNFRGSNPTAVNETGKAHRYIIPTGYCENMTFTNYTRMSYLGANGIYEDYEGDELYVEGAYDFTIKTLPIPAGTYEVRLGYGPTSWRGTAQAYMDGTECGAPINFALLANNPLVGWVSPGSQTSDPLGLANDSLLRTHGYMKAPSSFKCSISLYYNSMLNARQSMSSMRKILGTFTFPENSRHDLRFKLVASSNGDSQFMMDYLEFIPVSEIPSEGVD